MHHTYLGSAEIIDSIRHIAKFEVVTISNEADLIKFLSTLPTQEILLEQLKERDLGPEVIYDLSKNDTSIPKQLIKYGLDISSLKKAGVSPSSLMGLEYIVRGPAYDENGDMYFAQEQIRRHIDPSYLVNILGFTTDELLRDGLIYNY